MSDTLEFKILNHGTDRDPESMSLVEARAFMVLYQSLVNIVNMTDGKENSKISIKKGSLSTSVEGAVVRKITTDFNSIISASSIDSDLIKEWNNLKGLVQSNGLYYDFIENINGQTRSLIEEIKSPKRFQKKLQRKLYKTSIKFFFGKLIEVGGKTPNIHIDFGNNKVTVACEEQEADIAKEYLYKEISISVWTKKADNKEKYTLCDIYDEKDIYIKFKNFIENISKLDELDALSEIHDNIQAYLEKGEFYLVLKFMQLWASKSTNIQTLKTILIITKEFKHHETIATHRKLLLDIYEEKYSRLKSRRN